MSRCYPVVKSPYGRTSYSSYCAIRGAWGRLVHIDHHRPADPHPALGDIAKDSSRKHVGGRGLRRQWFRLHRCKEELEE